MEFEEAVFEDVSNLSRYMVGIEMDLAGFERYCQAVCAEGNEKDRVQIERATAWIRNVPVVTNESASVSSYLLSQETTDGKRFPSDQRFFRTMTTLHHFTITAPRPWPRRWLRRAAAFVLRRPHQSDHFFTNIREAARLLYRVRRASSTPSFATSLESL